VSASWRIRYAATSTPRGIVRASPSMRTSTGTPAERVVQVPSDAGAFIGHRSTRSLLALRFEPSRPVLQSSLACGGARDQRSEDEHHGELPAIAGSTPSPRAAFMTAKLAETSARPTSPVRIDACAPSA
jgi:hypothetical protein